MKTYTSFELHHVVTLLDRYADAYLLKHYGIGYSRFLVLLAIDGGSSSQPVNQHQIASSLAVGDAVVSRMLGPLKELGLVSVSSSEIHGRKNSVQLTGKGKKLVDAASKGLEADFVGLMAAAEVDEAQFRDSLLALKRCLGQ